MREFYLAARSPVTRERLARAGAVAAAVFAALYFPDRDDGSGALLGGVFAFSAVALGLAAVASVRPLPNRFGRERVRLLAAALVIGSALGIFNLVANYGIATLGTTIRDQMIQQWSEFSASSVLVAGVIVEEIGYRLLLMGGVAWLVSRVTRDRQRVFFIALGVSSLAFGLAHVLPGSRPTTGALHAITVTLKSTVGGVALGWVFWRKGLPYSMVCHSMANAVHLLAWPALF